MKLKRPFAAAAAVAALTLAALAWEQWQATAPARHRARLEGEIETLDAAIREQQAQAIRDAGDCAADAVQFGHDSDMARGCREAGAELNRITGELVSGLRRQRSSLADELRALPR